MKVELLLDASSEMLAARDHYEDEREGLGDSYRPLSSLAVDAGEVGRR